MLTRLATKLRVAASIAGVLFLPATGSSQQQYDLDSFDIGFLEAALWAEIDDIFDNNDNFYREVHVEQLTEWLMQALGDQGDEFVGDEEPQDDEFEQIITLWALETEIDEYYGNADASLRDEVRKILFEYDSRSASLEPSLPYRFVRVLRGDAMVPAGPTSQYVANRLPNNIRAGR